MLFRKAYKDIKKWYDSYNINKAYTLCQGNIEPINNRIYLPIYMIMFLKVKKK